VTPSPPSTASNRNSSGVDPVPSGSVLGMAVMLHFTDEEIEAQFPRDLANDRLLVSGWSQGSQVTRGF
jgi:hypothetical protein